MLGLQVQVFADVSDGIVFNYYENVGIILLDGAQNPDRANSRITLKIMDSALSDEGNVLQLFQKKANADGSFAMRLKLNKSSVVPYEIFKDYGYSKHVFFDADMIIQSDVKELFFNDINFGVCLDISALDYKTNIIFNNTESTDAYFNAGLMIVGKDIMKEEVYNKIFTFTKSLTPQYNFRKKLSWKGVLVKQDAMNEIFVNYTLIPHELYNQSHLLINNLNYKNTKIIHYCGSLKPWKEINFKIEMAAMIFYKYYFMRTNNFTLQKK